MSVRARLVATLTALSALTLAAAPAVPGSAQPRAVPGSELWAARYNGPGNDQDSGRVVAASPDGSRVFVAGESAGGATGYDYATAAYDPTTGAEVWASRYDGPGNGWDSPAGLAVAPDGSKVFITGRSWGGTTLDFATVAYDSTTGAELWVSRYKGPDDYDDNAWAIAVSPDGNKVFVTGNSKGSSTLSDFATVAYDSTTGAELWVSRYDGPGSANDLGRAIGVSPDGTKVFVTGESWGAGTGYDYATVAYDSTTGAEVWVKRYGGYPRPGGDLPTALAVGPAGLRVYVTGSTKHGGSNDYATVAYRCDDGERFWAKRYDGPAHAGDFARAIAVSPDGRAVFVTGQSFGGSATRNDYATIAYGVKNGVVLWLSRYQGPGASDDYATAVAVAPSGLRVYVTGETSGYGDAYTTISYNADKGTAGWLARYDGPGSPPWDSDRASSVVASAGRVIVTGWSGGATSGNDFATVAYAA